MKEQDESPSKDGILKVQQARSAPINYGYEFCCPFEFVGCELSFHPTQIDAYISHTITHFFDYRPPPKTISIFCPQIFENPNDGVANWREGMRHITDHYRRLERFEHSGPEFVLIEYMRQKRIIGIGHKPADIRRKEAKAVEARTLQFQETKRKKRRHDFDDGEASLTDETFSSTPLATCFITIHSFSKHTRKQKSTSAITHEARSEITKGSIDQALSARQTPGY
jgi:hypothetical protein